MRAEHDERGAVHPSLPQQIQPSVAPLQSDLADHDVVVSSLKCRGGGVHIGHRVNPEVGLVVENGPDALCNDRMLVDNKKSDHVTEIGLLRGHGGDAQPLSLAYAIDTFQFSGCQLYR